MTNLVKLTKFKMWHCGSSAFGRPSVCYFHYVNGCQHAPATHTLHDALLKFNNLTSIVLSIKGTHHYAKEYNITLIADFHYRHGGYG